MKLLLIGILRVYWATELLRNQLYTTIGLPTKACRYDPTCSHYLVWAVNKYGTMQGLILGFKRLATCHNFSRRAPLPK